MGLKIDVRNEGAILARALEILDREMRGGDFLTSPAAVRMFLRIKMHDVDRETFWCVWLNNQNRVIAVEEVARGTINEARVYPREVVKSALRCNAAAVIFAHNHPSGHIEPSPGDHALTATLRDALHLVDVKVFDHLIVAPGAILSFAERGLI